MFTGYSGAFLFWRPRSFHFDPITRPKAGRANDSCVCNHQVTYCTEFLLRCSNPHRFCFNRCQHVDGQRCHTRISPSLLIFTGLHLCMHLRRMSQLFNCHPCITVDSSTRHQIEVDASMQWSYSATASEDSGHQVVARADAQRWPSRVSVCCFVCRSGAFKLLRGQDDYSA